MKLNCKSSRSPWPGLTRPSTPFLRTYRDLQDVGARIKSEHGVPYIRINVKSLSLQACTPSLSGKVAEAA
jgi:hypothetical protein